MRTFSFLLAVAVLNTGALASKYFGQRWSDPADPVFHPRPAGTQWSFWPNSNGVCDDGPGGTPTVVGTNKTYECRRLTYTHKHACIQSQQQQEHALTHHKRQIRKQITTHRDAVVTSPQARKPAAQLIGDSGVLIHLSLAILTWTQSVVRW